MNIIYIYNIHIYYIILLFILYIITYLNINVYLSVCK